MKKCAVVLLFAFATFATFGVVFCTSDFDRLFDRHGDRHRNYLDRGSADVLAVLSVHRSRERAPDSTFPRAITTIDRAPETVGARQFTSYAVGTIDAGHRN